MKPFPTPLQILILTFSFLVISESASSQTNIFPATGATGIGTTTPGSSSVLDIVSTTKGVLFPRMTKAQRDAIATPVNGLLIYQTTGNTGPYDYNGTTWTSIPGANKSLNNLTTPTAVNLGLFANANNTLDLGSTANSWKDLYIDGSIYINDIKFIDNDSFFVNVFMGKEAGKLFQSSGCTGIGERVLHDNNVTGGSCVAIGGGSLYYDGSGSKNTAFGVSSLSLNMNGYNNTAFGENAGGTENHFYCDFFGINATATFGPANDFTSCMALGYASQVTDNYQIHVGDISILSIGGNVNWTNISDGRYKQHIKANVPGLEFINQLKPVTYTLDVNGIAGFLGADKRADIKDAEGKSITPKEDEAMRKLKQQGRDEKSKIAYTGFIAQDVEAAASSIGYDFSGVDKPQNEYSLYGLRYENFVVPSVKAVQELDEKNEQLTMDNAQLKMENSMLEVRVSKLESLISQNNFESTDGKWTRMVESNEALLLGQNVPTPFENSTIIPFRIPKDCHDASIMITNSSTLQVVMVVPVSCNETHLSVDAGILASGTFSYTLYAYGKMIDTKQMEVLR